eukprot:COSAG02_NODE_611_length_19555_cov_34.449270_7_plen_46_part_00
MHARADAMLSSIMHGRPRAPRMPLLPRRRGGGYWYEARSRFGWIL